MNKWNEHFASAKYPKGIAQQGFDYAFTLWYIKDNPMRKVRLPKRFENLDKIDNYYTLEELKHFFKCNDNYGNPKMAIFF